MDIGNIRSKLEKAFEKVGPILLPEFRQMVRNTVADIHFKKSRYVISENPYIEDIFEYKWNPDYPEYLMNHLEFFFAECFPDFPHRLFLELERRIEIERNQDTKEWIRKIPVDRLFVFLLEYGFL
jgi:hypothetical protein